MSKKKISQKSSEIKVKIQKVSMGIKPLGDRVVVEALSEEERVKKTKFGLVLPDTADRNKVDRGRVVAVGAGKMDKSGKRVPLEVKAGQVVIFPEFSSEKIKVDGKEYYIISESNILAVIG